MTLFLSYMLLGAGLVLVLEGMAYFAFPEAIRRMLVMVRELPPSTLRKGGLFAMVAGVVLIYFSRMMLG